MPSSCPVLPSKLWPGCPSFVGCFWQRVLATLASALCAHPKAFVDLEQISVADIISIFTHGSHCVSSPISFKTLLIRQVLEWWYTSGEERLAAQKVLPVPAPPPPLLPHPDGIPLPRNVTTCPICGRARTNPAVAVASGYTFCYPCIFNYVASHGCCPVTRIPTTVECIRRLYQSA